MTTRSACIVSADFYPSQIGGAGIYAFEICKGLAKIGWDVHAIIPSTETRVAHFESHPGIHVTFALGRQRLLFAVNAFRAFKRRYGGRSFDILHANELAVAPFALYRPRNVSALIASSHNSYRERASATKGVARKMLYGPYIALEKVSYSLVDGVITGAELEQDEMVRRYRINPAKTHMIYYGTDTERFTPKNRTKARHLRSELGIADHETVVLFVGRLVERKKPHVVLGAIHRLESKGHAFRCVIVGDGPLEGALVKRAHESGISSQVHFLGAVEYDKLPEVYGIGDIFVLPSQGEGGVSLAILEAAATGLPLVLTDDSSSHSPILSDGENGFIVRNDDVVSLAEAIVKASAQRETMGRKSRDIVDSYFSWDACVRRTVDVYEAYL